MAGSSQQSAARLRLMTDLKCARQDSPEGCSASPLNEENLFVWGATIFGPSETAWEGGIYSLRLTFTEAYPEKPPRVRFTSEMFHPNVYTDGTLCLDIIQDKWSPIYTVNTILTSIQVCVNNSHRYLSDRMLLFRNRLVLFPMLFLTVSAFFPLRHVSFRYPGTMLVSSRRRPFPTGWRFARLDVVLSRC